MLKEALEVSPNSAHKSVRLSGGLDVKRFCQAKNRKELRREMSLPEDSVILLTIRRLAPRMGLESLRRAMKTIERARENVILINS